MDNRWAQTNIAKQVAILATVANEKEQHWITGGHGKISLNKVATMATVADEEEQNWTTGGHRQMSLNRWSSWPL